MCVYLGAMTPLRISVSSARGVAVCLRSGQQCGLGHRTVPTRQTCWRVAGGGRKYRIRLLGARRQPVADSCSARIDRETSPGSRGALACLVSCSDAAADLNARGTFRSTLYCAITAAAL